MSRSQSIKDRSSTINDQSSSPRLLILGIGNLLMGDEGIGVHLVQRLPQAALPPNVDVLDGGTGGFHLMNYFTDYPTIVMIDATLDGRPPGTIRLLTPRFSSEFPRSMSTHDIGLRDLLEGLQVLGKLPKVYLFAVSVAELQSMQVGLSSEVEAAMPELIKQVVTLCEHLTGASATI
ncbi:MAG: hydrogenase maturation protease [Saprospiraceae bacterium]|nr:hydrogenase maturation protease [Lewinella sp.]